jgi:hypothetical protein
VMPMRPSFLISMWIPIRRYEREYPGELSAEPAEDAADGRRRYPDLRGDLLARVALPPQRLDRGTFGAGVGSARTGTVRNDPADHGVSTFSVSEAHSCECPFGPPRNHCVFGDISVHGRAEWTTS